MKMRSLLTTLWHRWKRRHTYRRTRFVTSMRGVPDHLENHIYVVGQHEGPKWVVLDCPCGLGHRLTVNLMKSGYPHWNLRVSRGKASLSPSVVVTDHPCHSHFFLERSRARWF